jgi:outer membrane protein assembly factor BamB
VDTKRIRALATIALSAVICAGCTSMDSGLFGGGGNDGMRVEKRADHLLERLAPLPLVAAWPVTPVPERIDALWVADGWGYAQGRSNTVYAIDLDTGILQWAYGDLDADLDTAPVRNATASYLLSQNRLTAISHLTGRVMWRRDAEIPISSPLEVSTSHVYAGTYLRTLQAWNLVDGRADWYWRLGNSTCTSAPSYAEPRVFVAAEDGAVYSLDASSGEGGLGEGALLKAKSGITGDVHVSGDNVYVASHDRNLYCLDRVSGKIRWTWIAETSLSQGALADDGLVYVRDDAGVLHALSETDGEHQWAVPRAERLVVAIDGDSYLIRADRVLLRIDSATGEELGRLRLDDWPHVPSTPGTDHLVLGTRDGYVFALEELDFE